MGKSKYENIFQEKLLAESFVLPAGVKFLIKTTKYIR